MHLNLVISYFDYKELICDKLAIAVNVHKKWLDINEIKSVGKWATLDRFPQLHGTYTIVFTNIAARVSKAKSIDELQIIKDKYPQFDLEQDFLPLYMNQFGRDEYMYNLINLEQHLDKKLPAKFTELDSNKFQPDGKINKQIRTLAYFAQYTADDTLPVVSTFIKTRTTYSYKLTLATPLTLGGIFNTCAPTDAIPYIAWNKFYKIYAPAAPQINTFTWSWQSNESINCKIQVNKNTFDELVIGLDTTGTELEWLVVTTSFNTSTTYQDIIYSLLPDLPHGNTIATHELYFGGHMYILNSHLNRNLFADFIMTTPNINEFIFIDESLKLIRQKQSIYLYYLPLHNIDEQVFNAHITQAANSIDLVNIPQQRGPHALLVKIHKIATTNHLTYFTKFLQVVFHLYSQQEPTLDDIYKKYKLDVGPLLQNIKVRKSHIPENVKLKYQVPGLFIEEYPKSCTNQPTIISDAEAKTTTHQVMRFPNDADAERNNLPVHNYICTHEKFKYPGLRENLLPNKNNYSCLPCCYTIDQFDKRSSRLNNYIATGTCARAAQNVGTNTNTTLKILGESAFGKCPSNIANMLLTIYGRELLRMGVAKSPDSFLYCIATALAVSKPDEYVAKIKRTFVATFPPIPHHQPLDYFDGKFFWGYVAAVARVNIWIWSSTGDDGYLTRPTTFQTVCHNYYPNYPYIHLFENYGNETSARTIPQYEIIVDRRDEFKTVQVVFTEHWASFVKFAERAWTWVQPHTTAWRNPIRLVTPQRNTDNRKQLLDTRGNCLGYIGDNYLKFTDTPQFPEMNMAIGKWPTLPYESRASVLTRFRYNKQLAREILWNAYWFVYEYNLSPRDLADYLVVTRNFNYTRSPHLPNITLIYDDKLHVPEDITRELIQTIERELPREQPRLIPDYYSSIYDFDPSGPNVIATSRFPLPMRADPIIIPPFDIDLSSFYITLEQQLYFAIKTETPTDPSIIWTIEPTHIQKFIINPTGDQYIVQRDNTDILHTWRLTVDPTKRV